MEPDRWKQIEEIYHAALERAAGERAAFLVDACGTDEQLRQQVASLLSFESEAADFIESPALEIAAAKLASGRAGVVIGQQIDQYKIESLLGTGGMGEVYLAHDTVLGRKVALKLLAPHLVADDQARARFVREARLASSLDHPNICTIHQVGEKDGQCFISMQFVDGATLSDAIADRGVDLDAFVSISLQVADALQTAHIRGVIHRDIKPGNILINANGQAKVLDFGLAKLLLSEGADEDTRLTQTGAIRGTPAYMSPEQARGETVDHRSDIFSFGTVLYEMATGKLPFQKGSKAETMSAIINEPHAPASDVNRKVPDALSAVIDRALAKNAPDRYQTMEEMLTDLRRVILADDGLRSSLDPLNVPDGIIRPFVPLRRSPSLSRRGRMLVGALVVAVALGGAAFVLYRLNSPASQPQSGGEKIMASGVRSIAILPFRSLGAPGNDDYLGLGLADAIITRLSRVDHFIVRPTSAVRKYASGETDAIAAGHEQQVDAVLEANMQQEGKRVRITARLFDVKDGATLMVYTHDEDLAQSLFLLQDSISERVANALVSQLTSEQATRLRKRDTESREAWQLYMQARHNFEKRTEDGLRKGIEGLQRAIDADPLYARAYGTLAQNYLFLSDYGVRSPTEMMPRAKAAAVKAIEIDATLAEPHLALAYVKFHDDFDWAAAEDEFRTAIRLEPNFATARHFYALFLGWQGRFDEAMSEIQQAQTLDPLSMPIASGAVVIDGIAQRYDKAITDAQRALELSPDHIRTQQILGLVYIWKGRHSDAIETLSRAYDKDKRPEIYAWLGMAYAAAGQESDARRIITDLEQQAVTRHIVAYDIAAIYANLGDPDKAFEWLGRAIDARDAPVVIIKVDPRLARIRSDVRFADTVRRIGLTP